MLKSKNDRRVYSMADTSMVDRDETIIIPGAVGKFETKEIGTTVEVSPRILTNGSIRLDGKITETTLVDVEESNPAPRISAGKNTITTDLHRQPKFETVEERLFL